MMAASLNEHIIAEALIDRAIAYREAGFGTNVCDEAPSHVQFGHVAHRFSGASSPRYPDCMKLQFDDFAFDPLSGELWRGTEIALLQPQPAKVLALLVARSGQVVTRAEIQSYVWGSDTHIDFEQGLNWCIRKIREALGDSPTNSRYVQTIPRRGYRFIGKANEPTSLAVPNGRTPWWRSRRVAAATVVLMVPLIWGGIVSGRSAHPPVTVLVLPFDNVSDPNSGSHYEDIASDQLTAHLALLNPKKLSVIDPLTARKFKNTKECIIKIGNQLGADYVLLGEVEPSSTLLRVDAELFKVSTNRQVWAEERQISRNEEFSPVWQQMSTDIGAELQRSASSKN